MGKKKKKPRKPASHQWVEPSPHPAPTPIDDIKEQNAKAEAISRLATAFKELSKPPEKIVDLLTRLEIPYTVNSLPTVGDGQYDTLIIKMSDLEAGEQRNQEQGSLMQRLYPQK